MVIAPAEIVDLAGLRTTSVPRTLEDLALPGDRDQFIAVVDAMLHERDLHDGGLADLRRRLEARGGRERARGWWPMIDGRAESALETRLRLLLADAGLAPDESQWAVHDPVSGRFVARVDVAWPTARLAVEADGVGPHSEPAALLHDRRRQNDLVRLGWKVLAAPGGRDAWHA